MRFFYADPVGLPGLAAIAVGFAAFFVALFAARSRSKKGPESPDAGRNSRSIVWIIVQGVGIGIAGFGPLRLGLDPLSDKAIIEGAAVLVLMLGAVWLFDASSRAMGRNWALVARTREDGNLVQNGPFALIRNPIYVALFCFMIALGVAYGHTTNLLAAVPIFALGTWMRVRHEEVVLRATFGAAFDDYVRRVKRFVPGVF